MWQSVQQAIANVAWQVSRISSIAFFLAFEMNRKWPTELHTSNASLSTPKSCRETRLELVLLVANSLSTWQFVNFCFDVYRQKMTFNLSLPTWVFKLWFQMWGFLLATNVPARPPYHIFTSILKQVKNDCVCAYVLFQDFMVEVLKMSEIKFTSSSVWEKRENPREYWNGKE